MNLFDPPNVDAATDVGASGGPAWRRAFSHGIDHERVLARIVEESGWSARFIFMIMMSAGIAVLGLLLSSPAVVIGAMLISPLMNPILGLGFGLATFDFAEMRRSLAALASGTLIAVAFTALIVLASPLKAPTAEILARTRPNLFDLLVALFAALAGTFAIIRGRGETITGVAIATALMPPLAVVGYGIATWNLPVFGGALALFVTNFVTIALSATVMARLYGFGHQLSHRQSWLQTSLLILVFVAMGVPLALSLSRIAREALIVSQVRSMLSEQFGAQSRVTQLDIDFDAEPAAIRTVVIAPQAARADVAGLDKRMEERLGRAVDLQLDQVLLAPGATALDAQRTELQQAKESAAVAERESDALARLVALAAGVSAEAVTLDRDHRRVEASAAALPDAGLAAYWVLEQRIRQAVTGWSVAIRPPLKELPPISFADGNDQLDPTARRAVLLSAWAAKRWNVPALTVPGFRGGEPAERLTLAQRRGAAVADQLRRAGVAPVAAPAEGQSFRLTPSTPATEPL
ncbi:DUF389 domain-containing protein [Sphingomonas sp. ID0503]|uniref:DUF389 domain-containing protein n=1 Tax=Sphingomonas sp. ID0503 TaxID=3399691 RepID=UPI003AFA3A96